ncbi:hypothetical protein LTR85_001144 [Meristemomyces frigidus]|nr:hypothetical protein LTR85_001144 [Meristemomyces frigidus]
MLTVPRCASQERARETVNHTQAILEEQEGRQSAETESETAFRVFLVCDHTVPEAEKHGICTQITSSLTASFNNGRPRYGATSSLDAGREQIFPSGGQVYLRASSRSERATNERPCHPHELQHTQHRTTFQAQPALWHPREPLMGMSKPIKMYKFGERPAQDRRQFRPKRSQALVAYNLFSQIGTERLRYFRPYLQTVEYSVNASIVLDAQARTHSFSLASQVLDGLLSEVASGEDHNALVTYSDIHIDQPADVPDLPADLFMESGCEDLACNFMTDTDILVPRLVPPMGTLRKAVLEPVHHVRNLYFHTIVGIFD